MKPQIIASEAFSKPLFLADDPALDFLNSLDMITPHGAPIDWISSGEGFMNWLEHSSLVPVAVIERFRKETAPEVINTLAAKARELREWFRVIIADKAGNPLQSADSIDMIPLNKLLARDDSFYQIEVQALSQKNDSLDGSPLSWRQERRWHTVEDLLLPIAKVIGNLVCTADFRQIKYCEGAKCALWFYDHSKNQTRRWCSMAICGNRAKAAAHRAKRRASSAG